MVRCAKAITLPGNQMNSRMIIRGEMTKNCILLARYHDQPRIEVVDVEEGHPPLFLQLSNCISNRM